ncbi:MAG: hypothetical protein M3081_06635 [Gemmatimonadota bacterium]|nr:hypothetical protein [Gemmatimonadota bacterium]
MRRIILFLLLGAAAYALLAWWKSAWAIVVVLTAPWWLGPILAKDKIRLPAGTTYDRIALSDVPAWARTHLDDTSDLLAPLGFVSACALRDANPRWTGYIGLLERESDSTGALALSAEFAVGDQRRRLHQVEVFTNLVGVGNITVTDFGLLPKMFPSAPTRIVERFPGVDAPRLVRALDALVRPHAAARRVPMHLATKGGAYLSRNAVEQYEEHAAAGYVRRTADGSLYLGTWKGAIVAGWRLVPPTKQILMARARRRANQLLTRLGV